MRSGLDRNVAWNETTVDLTKVGGIGLFLSYNQRNNNFSAKRFSSFQLINFGRIKAFQASRAHTRAFIARKFVEAVNNVSEPVVRSILKDLLDLYLHYELLESSQSLLEVSILYIITVYHEHMRACHGAELV